MSAPMISRCDSGCCCFAVGITENLHSNIKAKTQIICFFLTATRNTIPSPCLSSHHEESVGLEKRKAHLKLITSFSCPLCIVNNPVKRIDNFFMHSRIFILFCCHSFYLSPFIYLVDLEIDFLNEWETSPPEDLCFTSPPLIDCTFVFPFPAFFHATIKLSDSSWHRYLHFESKLNFKNYLLSFHKGSLMNLDYSFRHWPFKSVVLSLYFHSWCVLLVFATCSSSSE